MTSAVVDVPVHNRYELQLDGEKVGHIDYVVDGSEIHLTHTEVDPNRQERGLGSDLVRGALDQIRSDTAYRVIPDCPFVASWLKKNDDYADLTTR